MLEWVVSRMEILYKLYQIVKSEIPLYDDVYDMSEYINRVAATYFDPENHILFNCNKKSM
jgi:hypothetical protein